MEVEGFWVESEQEMESQKEIMPEGSNSVLEGPKRPRLFIKELVMRNFKSYGGEQRVGPFHKRFSALVGPNGSGKSNVIDAMLFVFGKRAKQMRLNKVSELIHNSTSYQNLDSAEVSVYFQEIVDLDDGTYEVVPESDFVITRVVFRDSSSKYYINNRTSNFTEVTKKLKEKGVDLDNNRFLILQGEVEQISLMKPKAQGPHDEGFLEYLEEIIGTRKYVEKIDESCKQLESFTEKRSGALQMLKLAEKERDGLEGAKNEAVDYMLKELSFLKWQEKATKMAHEETVRKMVKVQQSVSNLEENLKSERDKIVESKQTLKELETVHSTFMKRQEELHNDMRQCKEESKEFKRQDVKYHVDIKHLSQKIKKVEDKSEKDSAEVETHLKECDEAANLIPQLEDSIPKLQKLLLDEEKILEEIKESSKVETEKFRIELAKVRAELEPWEKELIEHKGKLEVACTENKLLNEKHETARVDFKDAQKQMGDILEKIKLKTAESARIQSDIEMNKRKASEARQVENESVKEQEKLIPLEQAARQKVAELKYTLDSEKRQGSVLKAILKAKETKQIEGIYGRMGDLGAIDAKYDIAISTACPGLDYIVVETTNAAQACVELLRRENLGVATFLILEKQVHLLSKLKENVSIPEGVPRLFDLVNVGDERMKLAFFAVLGNTIVASDLDQATRIAYGGNKEFRRVVTLDGALFENSGTMSGGGGKPRGGKMGTSIRGNSVSADDVANAERELSHMVDTLHGIRQRITEAVQQYQALENAVAALEMELAKCQKEVDSLNSQNSYIEKQLDSLKATSKPRKEELDRLEELKKIISGEEKEINRLIDCSKPLKAKASELQRKIENSGGERLRSQKSKVEKTQSDIDDTLSDINRRKVQIETAQKMMQKLTKRIEDSKKEKERLQDQEKRLNAIIQETEEKLFAVQENYQKTQQMIDEHKVLLEKTKIEYDKMTKIVDEFRASEVDTDFKLKDMKRAYKELEVKAKECEKKLDEFQTDLGKHLEQLQVELVDSEKIQATLADKDLNEPCDLVKAVGTAIALEAQLKEMNPNLNCISEYREKVSLYNERLEEFNRVTREWEAVKRQYDEWKRKRLDEFMEGFNIISLKLKEMYQMITVGGDAELELVDSLDPFAGGVVFSVRPPKKSWKRIANLSGGEKTLSSLSLVFALHHYKPTPLYVMDEIDAALDFNNVSIIGHYLKGKTKDAQFIIISLRDKMFELADLLIGILKINNCTKSISING